MFCKNCGAEIPSECEFCSECGTATAGNHSDNEGEKNQVKPAKLSSKQRNLILTIVLVFVAFVELIVMGLFFGDDKEEPVDPSENLYIESLEGEKNETGSKKLTFDKFTDKNDAKTNASGKYYPGTDILTFTEVTGVPIYEAGMDDDGTYEYTYSGYTDDFQEIVYDLTDMAEKYTEALANEGYTVSEPRYSNDRSLLYMSCVKERNAVIVGFPSDPDSDDKTDILNLCHVLPLTNRGLSQCSTCMYKGYDTCQGHTCDICGGRGNQTCSGCNGTGLARVPSRYSNKCVVCYGQGTQICPNCKGAGKKFYD